MEGFERANLSRRSSGGCRAAVAKEPAFIAQRVGWLRLQRQLHAKVRGLKPYRAFVTSWRDEKRGKAVSGSAPRARVASSLSFSCGLANSPTAKARLEICAGAVSTRQAPLGDRQACAAERRGMGSKAGANTIPQVPEGPRPADAPRRAERGRPSRRSRRSRARAAASAGCT